MLDFLHIPRTGGTARQYALQPEGLYKFSGHDTPISKVRRDDTPVIFVRDPVTRFVSAYDHIWRRNDVVYEWRSAEHMALDIERAYPAVTKVIPNFRKQVWWFDTDLRGDDLLIGRQEHMQEDLDFIVGHHVGLPTNNHRNASKRDSTISEEAKASLRQFYAEDIALLQSLEGVFV